MEKRSSPRRELSMTVSVKADGVESEAMMFDVSDTGARIILRNEFKLPATFALSLTQNNSVMRYCELAWQDGRTAGVKFVRKPNKAGKIAFLE